MNQVNETFKKQWFFPEFQEECIATLVNAAGTTRLVQLCHSAVCQDHLSRGWLSLKCFLEVTLGDTKLNPRTSLSLQASADSQPQQGRVKWKRNKHFDLLLFFSFFLSLTLALLPHFLWPQRHKYCCKSWVNWNVRADTNTRLSRRSDILTELKS